MNIVLAVAFDNEKAGIFLNKIEFLWVVAVVAFNLSRTGTDSDEVTAALEGPGLVQRPLAGLLAPDFTTLPHASDSVIKEKRFILVILE